LRFAVAADYASPTIDGLVAGLAGEMESRGHRLVAAGRNEAIPTDVDVVLNVTSAAAPRANYLRAKPSHFICTLTETWDAPGTLQRDAYGVLVKTMSNLTAYTVHRSGESSSYLVTPELGFREVRHGGDHVRRIAEQVLAISDVRFAIENEFSHDLPEALRDGDAITASLAEVGRKLDALGLLQSVLPLDEILSPRDLRLLQKIFGIKQLSYGNLSARRDASTFWMTGRGVDKGNLRRIGSDILLVTGFDEERRAMRVSVPPGNDPTARVSVDAIEHFKIYRAFPGIGAILHVHAWLPGIASTLQSYPCGSVELADEVLALVHRAPDPQNAVVGLRNHGITATGPDLPTLFDRLDGRLERQVPMV
jgi:ribulose-5-phosphate 4-epimerase/fuculose-1-phosphate aldolase